MDGGERGMRGCVRLWEVEGDTAAGVVYSDEAGVAGGVHWEGGGRDEVVGMSSGCVGDGRGWKGRRIGGERERSAIG